VGRPRFFPSRIVFLATFAAALCLSAAQDLAGPTTRDAVLAIRPSWRDLVASYQPGPEALAKLQGLDREVRIDVFFGTWCSDSMAHVSAFFKVLDLADNPRLESRYVAIPEDKTERATYFEGRRGITRLPTFIVMVDGREAGRIVETPKKSVEADLVKILGL
jgi:thiol-disulfide isomerase/thioredoxin